MSSHDEDPLAIAATVTVRSLLLAKKKAKEEQKNTLAVLSLRGYVRLVGLPSKRTPPETVKLRREPRPVTPQGASLSQVSSGPPSHDPVCTWRTVSKEPVHT